MHVSVQLLSVGNSAETSRESLYRLSRRILGIDGARWPNSLISRLQNHVDDLVCCCQGVPMAAGDTRSSCWSFWYVTCKQTSKFQIFDSAAAAAAGLSRRHPVRVRVTRVLPGGRAGWKFSVRIHPLPSQNGGGIHRADRA